MTEDFLDACRPDLPFLGLLPQEKLDALSRGEKVQIIPEECSRFLLAMDELKERRIKRLEGAIAKAIRILEPYQGSDTWHGHLLRDLQADLEAQ